MLRTASIKEIKKITEATGDLFRNKIADAAAKSDNGKTVYTIHSITNKQKSIEIPK